jgi:signal peptidase I
LQRSGDGADPRAGDGAAAAGAQADTRTSNGAGTALPFALGLSPFEAMRREHDARGARIGRAARRLFRIALAAVAVALLLRLAFVERLAVSGDAMAPTLSAGETILVDKAAYGWSGASLPAPIVRMLAAGSALGEGGPTAPRLMARPAAHGDIVVFHANPAGTGAEVGRVIALAGERVAIRNGRVWRNGVALACTPAGPGLCREGIGGIGWLVRPATVGADMAEMVVPPGYQFVAGDNRSLRIAGARAAPAGLVADSRLIGRARRIMTRSARAAPPDGPGTRE